MLSFFMKTLMNVSLLDLKLNFCIGPNSKYVQNTFYGYAFTLS